MRNLFARVGLLLGIAFLAGCQTHAPQRKPHNSKQWETAIQAFEATDRTNPPPKNAIVFVGSSSIRRWESLASDFPGYKVINRGFGGSHLADSVVFADRIVIPYLPSVVLIYAGDNDIASGKSAEDVFADFKDFVRKVQRALPDARIGFISIKPCPAREKYLDSVRKTNRLVKNYTRGNGKVFFIDVFTPMLNAEGKPRPELFVKDGLHPNKQCYELWASIIKQPLGMHQN